MTDKVLTRIDDDGNATVMLNRPDVHNAFDPDMVAALTNALEQLGGEAASTRGRARGRGAELLRRRRHHAHEEEREVQPKKQNYEAALQTARMLHALHSHAEADDRVRARRGARRRLRARRGV